MPEPPYAEGGPAGRCAAALLQGLHADDRIELTAVAARLPAAAIRELPRGVPVEAVAVPLQDRREAWTDLLRRPLGYLSRGEFGARVRTLAAEAEIIHLDQVHSAWCDLGTDVPSLVHLHFLVRLDRPGPPAGLRAATRLFGLGAAERAAVRRHRFLVANSPVVAGELRRRAPQADVTVVPLVLDPGQYGPAADVPQVAGFIGQGVWPTTAASARRLVERVWPLVRRELPEARLLVAGRGIAELGLPETPGVDVVGEVDSAAGFLRDISLLLFPTERGSGMKVKVLEALACGLPVVTTATGAEGIAATEGIVVAEEDAELARAAVSILRDDEERRQRGAEARRTFEKHHTPAVAARAFAELYERMAASR
jgi:glycosyltransferase involved in cell wall biosynthesis